MPVGDFSGGWGTETSKEKIDVCDECGYTISHHTGNSGECRTCEERCDIFRGIKKRPEGWNFREHLTHTEVIERKCRVWGSRD